jgi:hypothetical protein
MTSNGSSRLQSHLTADTQAETDSIAPAIKGSRTKSSRIMAEDIAPTPDEFEAALTELLGSFEQDRALNNAGAAPKRVSVPTRTLGGQRMRGARHMTAQEQTMQERPWVQMGRDAGALATSAIDTAGLGLPGVALDYAAPNALAGIRENEALANPGVTGVGTALGVVGMQPRLALSALGGAYAAAGADDLGLISGMSSAEAQTKLTRDQRRAMEIERQRAERDAAIQQRAGDAQAKRDLEAADAKMQRDLLAQKKGSEQGEYDRQVAESEAAYKQEMDRNRRFSDTTVGKLYDATGGLAPAVMGFIGAKASRLATGPGESTAGMITKDYALPVATGTLAGMITPNAPLYYNSQQTEPDNPKKRAYEARAELLPPNHPRRQEFMDYAKSLPNENPVREAASKDFSDPEKIKQRLVMGGLEGFAGGLLGSDAVRAAGRAIGPIANRLGLASGGLKGPQRTPAIPGVVVDDIPVGQNALAGPTAAPRLAGPTQPATLAAGGQPPHQAQLPAPAAPANPPASVVTRVKGKDGKVTHHDEAGLFTSNPRKPRE